MGDVAVAFPNDEASAHVIASRLGASGIAARVDRGLHASWQVAPIAQLTVLVDERDAERAREVLGTERPRDTGLPAPVLRVAIAVLAGVVALGVVAVVATALR